MDNEIVYSCDGINICVSVTEAKKTMHECVSLFLNDKSDPRILYIVLSKELNSSERSASFGLRDVSRDAT